MGKVSESIYTDRNVVIPMADVQHIEKQYHNTDLVDGTKKGDLMGAMVITRHTRWDMEADCWANNIWLSAKQVPEFLKAWCYYRYELESEVIKLHNQEDSADDIEEERYDCPIHGLQDGPECPRC